MLHFDFSEDLGNKGGICRVQQTVAGDFELLQKRLQTVPAVHPVMDHIPGGLKELRYIGSVKNAGAGESLHSLVPEAKMDGCGKMQKGIIRHSLGPVDPETRFFRPVMADAVQKH